MTQTKTKSGFLSIKTKQNISKSLKGRKASAATKLKLSIARRGEYNSMYGKKHSAETIKKMTTNRSRCYKGENNPMFGNTHSVEARKKISESAKINKNRSKIVLDTNTGIYYDSLLDYTKYSTKSRVYNWKRLVGLEYNNLGIIYA